MKKRGKKNALAKQRAPGSAAESEALPAGLLKDVRYLIEQARQRVAGAVNAELTGLYWRIGRRIQHDILHEDRAAYGEQILSTLSTELSWSHFVEIIPLKDDLHRDFYAEMCRVERWSVRTLRAKIGGMLYEHTALSKKPAVLARQELAALREEDRLVAIDLKLGRFRAADKGQMELYLRWLDENDRQPGEEVPLGLILCATKSAEQVRLLRLAESGIRVAEYMTELPPRQVLEHKLREAIRLARGWLALAPGRQGVRKGKAGTK